MRASGFRTRPGIQRRDSRSLAALSFAHVPRMALGICRRQPREREDSAREEAPERRVAEGVKAEMRGPAEAGPVALISDCACPPCYLPIYLLARVLEEIRDHRVACIGTPIRTR